MRGRTGLLVLGCLLAILPVLTTIQPAQAAGASYYFSPSTLRLNVGQTATVTLYVAAPDQVITAGDGTVVLPAQLTPTSVNKSGSVFSLWPEEPGISGSTIRFAGGKPSPGFQGASGKIISFTVRGAAEGTGLITLSGGRIFYNDANVYTGAGNATAVVTRVVSGAAISSTTHPDQNNWYKSGDASLTWTKSSGASSYSYTLSHDGGQASKTGGGPATAANFAALADGVWTFSLTTTYSDGKTATSSFTIRVDTSAPSSFTTTIEHQGAADPRPILKFKATDQPSGIKQYEILIDGVSVGTTIEEQFQLPIQIPGTHTFTVRAFDQAGNTTDSTGTFTVEGFPGPELTKWPILASVLEPIFFKGKARFDSKVILYIDGKPVAEFFVKENLSDETKRSRDITALQEDENVEWSYSYQGTIPPGLHVVYAHQQQPNGALSNRSNEVQVTVLWTVIKIFGLSLPTLLVGLIGIIMLLIVLAVMWYRFRFLIARIRRRIKRSEESVNHDFNSLEKNLSKDEMRLKEPLEMTRANIEHELDTIFKKDPTSPTDKAGKDSR